MPGGLRLPGGELALGGVQVQPGVIGDERGQKLAAFDDLSLQHLDGFDDTVDESGRLDRVRIGFDPSGGLENHRRIEGGGFLYWYWQGKDRIRIMLPIRLGGRLVYRRYFSISCRAGRRRACP